MGSLSVRALDAVDGGQPQRTKALDTSRVQQGSFQFALAGSTSPSVALALQGSNAVPPPGLVPGQGGAGINAGWEVPEASWAALKSGGTAITGTFSADGMTVLTAPQDSLLTRWVRATADGTKAVGGTIDGHSASVPWGASLSAVATALAARFTSTTPIAAEVTSVAAAAVVELAAVTPGAAGNAITLVAVGPAAASAATLEGGADAVAATGVLTIPNSDPGVPVSVDVGTFTVSVPWNTDGSTTAGDWITQLALVAGAAALVTASPAANVVTLTDTTPGAAGNAVTLANATGMTLSGAHLGTGAGAVAGADAIAATGTLTIGAYGGGTLSVDVFLRDTGS